MGGRQEGVPGTYPPIPQAGELKHRGVAGLVQRLPDASSQIRHGRIARVYATL